MDEISDALGPGVSLLRRRWWLPLLAGGLAGGLAFGLTAGMVNSRVYGLVNARAAVTLPNDRIDLIQDLSVAVRQRSVLEEPAEEVGWSVSRLRDAIEVKRIQSSNLVSVSIAFGADREAGEKLVTSVVESAASFLSAGGADGSAPVPYEEQIAAAGEEVTAARVAVTEAVLKNGGIPPDVELQALQNRALRAGAAGEPSAELRQAIDDAGAFDALKTRLELARNAVTTLSALSQEAQANRATQQVHIPVSLQGRDTSSSDNTVRMRRAAAAGLGGAIAVAAIILLIGGRGRRREGFR